MNKRLLAMSIAIAVSLYGCGGSDDTKKPAASSASSTAVKDTAQPTTSSQAATTEKAEATQNKAESATLDQKLSVYIGCYNRLTGGLSRSVNRYASWVKDMKAGPTGKESLVYGLYDVNVKDTTQCKEQIVSIAKDTTELDQAAIAFADTSEKLAININKLYPYYEEEDYKDDEFKKGKEFHPEFVANAEAYFVALDKFSSALEAENDKKQQQHLAEIEKAEGKSLSYYRVALLIDAKKLMNLMKDEEFSVDEAKVLLDQYNTVLEAAVAATEATDYETNAEKVGVNASSFKSLVSKAKDFNKTSKERFRRVRDKEPYSTGEKMNLNPSAGWMVNGSTYKLQRTYNELVGSYNRS